MSSKKRKKTPIEEEVDSASGEENHNNESPQQNSEGEGDYDLDDDETESQAKRRKSESGEPQVGIVEEVTLVNFMCHEHFNMKFGPNVNFIVGENGSGKSAVLVALTIGLGAKATFTNRGSKLNDLIRKGANSATITIRLRNRGSEAYRHDQYGDSIIIERKINKDGGGGYKLRDVNGKLVSSTRSELSIIMEQFNIQVNNPVAILMQDTSRSFLTTSSSKDKYKFFLMATQLDQMEKDFIEVKEHLDSMESMLQRKKKSLPAYKTQLDEYEAEYNQLDSLRKLEERLTASQNMFAWAHVVEVEENIEKTQEDLEAAEAEKVKRQKEEVEINHLHEKAKADMENKNSILESASEKLKAINLEKSSLQEEVKAKRKELSQAENKVKDIKKRAENVVSRRKRVEAHINEVRQKSAKDKSNERNRVQTELQKKRDELNSINEEYNRSQEKKTQLEEQLDALEEQLKKITGEENYKKDKKNSVLRDFKTMEQSKKDSTKVFGAWVPPLLDLQDKHANKFKYKPVGPIGMRIKVKEEKWATAIEKSLGGSTLSSFIIGKDPGDKELLKQLSAKAGLAYENLPFIISPWRDSFLKPNDVPDEKFTTFLDVLEVEDHWIFNTLLDLNKIDKKVLIETAPEARKVMFSDNPPANVREVWTMEGAKLHNPGGSNSFVPPPKGQRKYLSVDYDKAMSLAEAQIRELNGKLEEISGRRKELEQERNQLRRQLETIRHSLPTLQMNMNNLRRDIQDLEAWKEEPTEDVTELEEGLQNLAVEEEKYKSEMEEATKQVEKCKKEVAPIEKRISEIEAQTDDQSEELERLKESVTKSVNQITSTQGKLENVKRGIENAILKAQKAKFALEDLQKKLKDATTKASEWCPRVEVTKSKETISREIQATRDSIAKEKEGRKDPAEVTRNYLSAKEKWREMNEQISKLSELKEKLNENLSERVKKWLNFRRKIATRTLQYFNYNLSQKGFAGKLDFDHDAKKLEISVQLEKQNNKTQEIRDTKSLSGGERSYSTVSLLLALWEAMETPFRAMDEFDVFMDSVNRQISIELLIDSALENKQRQYIFISPHDYSVIKTRPGVRINKMRAPIRGQGTLNFSQGDQ